MRPAGTILAAVDTSGSIDAVTLNAFRDELQGILDSGVCERLRVVYCDAALQGEAEFDSGDTIELKPKGFGGTAFGPVMEWADAQDEGVCLVYLTDLYGSHGKQPAVPVLWAAIDPRAPDAPFGERVNVDPFDK
jgi:predicted metal-dependent peptidase